MIGKKGSVVTAPIDPMFVVKQDFPKRERLLADGMPMSLGIPKSARFKQQWLMLAHLFTPREALVALLTLGDQDGPKSIICICKHACLQLWIKERCANTGVTELFIVKLYSNYIRTIFELIPK